MRGLQGRRRSPKEKIVYGEKGVKGIRYTGEMPCDVRGNYTGMLYAYNERRPVLGIDVRDLPGLADSADIENLEIRQPDGSFRPLAEILQTDAPVRAKKAKREPELAEELKPQGDEAEVTE